METRAHHLLIGTFMLVLVAGLVAFIVWMGKYEGEQSYDRYLIYFEGSISGLSEGSSVRLNGVPVGTVRDITLPRDEPSRVRVRVRIQADVPIREGSTARLEPQGFTGISVVQISGGKGAQEISAKQGARLPVIPSKPSPIQQVFEEAPNLINTALLAVNNLEKLTGEENRKRVASILANLETLSGNLAGNVERVEPILGEMEQALAEFRASAAAIRELSQTTDSVMDEEVRRAFAEVADTAEKLDGTADELRGLVTDTRPAVTRFANTALPEASRLITDLRELSRRTNRLVEQIEQNPREALFGGSGPVYRPEEQE